mmetsp:Transcript_54881/g.66119  ORF Transcript_54881/g.66119 Transcript_54881/m.66119 type:complete len:96 (-) Transcript_54881:118-405(-)
MDGRIEIVLPCSHGYCHKCACHWVRTHEHCPICRDDISKKEFEDEQWLLETWSETDIVAQITEIRKKLSLLWARVRSRRKPVDLITGDGFLELTL